MPFKIEQLSMFGTNQWDKVMREMIGSDDKGWIAYAAIRYRGRQKIQKCMTIKDKLGICLKASDPDSPQML